MKARRSGLSKGVAQAARQKTAPAAKAAAGAATLAPAAHHADTLAIASPQPNGDLRPEAAPKPSVVPDLAATRGPDAMPEPAASLRPVAQADGHQTGTEPDAQGLSVPREAAILIELDPTMSGGYVHNRFDVMIRGCARSTVALDQIRLRIDDQTLSAASYGRPERAAVGVMPDGAPARQRAFQFTLPRQASGRPERCTFQIVARAIDGREHAESFTIELDPAAAEPVSMIAGPARSGLGVGGTRAHVLMYVERGTIDGDGVLVVQGWALALGPILAVQVFAGGARVAAARLGGEREDVALAHPAYPNARLSGFGLTIHLPEEDRQAPNIRVQLVCPNGFAQEETVPVERIQRRPMSRPPAGLVAEAVAPSSSEAFSAYGQHPGHQPETGVRIDKTPLMGQGPQALPPVAFELSPASPPAAREAPSSEIRMFCDEAALRGDGRLFVNGWAVCAAGIAQVRVLLDDKDVGLAVFGHERVDVGALYASVPTAHVSGFRFDSRLAERFEGEHVVRVVVRNARNEEHEDSLQVVATPVIEAPPPPDPAATGAEPDPDQAAEFRFELDAPALLNGAMIEPVTGRLTIEGWLLSRSGIASFEVHLDDQRLGDAHHGLARQDVGSAFPEWPNALRSGYAFHCPPRSLREGDHTIQLKLRSNSGQDMVRQFKVTVRKSEDQQDQLCIRRRVPRAEADLMADLLDDLDYHPAYCFILHQGPLVNVGQVSTTLNALRLLAFKDWSARVLAADDDAASAVWTIIQDQVPHLVDRFTILSPSDSTRWTAPLAGPWLGDAADSETRLYALLQAGDEPGADALLELAVVGGRNRDADMLYADEVRPSPVTNEREAFFKPDLSPDLLSSMNYFGRLWVVTAALLAKTGVTPASLLLEGEYDLALRCAELAGRVHHVPRILCGRAADGLDDPDQEQAALRRMLLRRGIAADVLPTQIPGTWRVKRKVLSNGLVSIIIPTCAAHGYIETVIKTLRAKTAYPNYEIICIDNIPPDQPAWKAWLRAHADKVVDCPGAFNWSIFNNLAAEAADGDYLLFMNDDMEIVREDWLEAMMEHAQRPEVGVTGPQLLYPDGKVQHAGMFLATPGIGRHAFRFASHDEPSYFGLALTQRNVIAVTGACLLVRRETFERLGRFEEAHQIVNNDLDFCLRAHRAGLLTVFTPYASLTHHELASRATMKDVFDLTHFNAAWKTLFAAGDPYFNPRLSRHADDYRPDDEPVQWITPGSPLFHREEIERILVVKLDHIGDFVTALPPIRRLKEIFPHATITVLAGRASRAFASIEAGIDEFIPFDFFHARSQLGARQLEKDDFAGLAQQLRPYRFDLAVDLRKHLSTRDVLKYAGARFLAGFDYLGQFPFLDISLDWDGDRTLQRKRSHIIDDLLALVNAIEHATKTDRLVMRPQPARMPLTEPPPHVRALFGKPVVAVHPGAGNVTKQWPTEHFSALIDLLIEKQDVNVLLVGGPDEVEVADMILASVLHPGSVASMAGQTSLADLPRLLLNCALYVGNDSGPKHIAAAIGMPTIGVHSGVVDPVEWGPLGPRAVALRRNMTCSPCYLANADDCPRALACLRFLEPNLVYEAAVTLLKPPASRTDDRDIEAEVTEPAIAPAAHLTPVRPPDKPPGSAARAAPIRRARGKARQRQTASQPA